VFGLNSIYSAELRPSYTNCGLIDVSSEMPFRMTRNLLNFITRAGLNGPFHIILVAASEALMGEGDILNNQLSLFFRDDLLSWHDVKHKSRPDSDVRLSDENILQLVEKNVQMVIQRVKKLSLKKLSDHSCASPITELLNIATSPEQQSAMPPTWYPWL
jgi:phosphatidylinositol kinase/protein kinase (PI-3  family)